MAKLRGKQYSIDSAREGILRFVDEAFPNLSPHHLVIMTDKEYKERQESRKSAYSELTRRM